MRLPLKPAIRSLYADRDAVIIFFAASGTARDGKPYANTYAWLLDMHEGKVIRAYTFFDSIGFNDLWSRVKPEAA
jgi:ketosteroid isomerase-like protein